MPERAGCELHQRDRISQLFKMTESCPYECYDNSMKRHDENEQIQNPKQLQLLLDQRRLPLTPEGEQKVLQQLAVTVSSSHFLVAIQPVPEMSGSPEVPADHISHVTLLQADGKRYLPVFSCEEMMQYMPGKIDEHMQLYWSDIVDLASFLSINRSVEAAVVNPGKDDLVLDLPLLTNLLNQYNTSPFIQA